MNINSLFACLLLFSLLFTFPFFIPSASAQVKSTKKVPMAHRASQAQRYSTTRGLAKTEIDLPVNISSTIIEHDQPLRIQSNETPYKVNILAPNGKKVLQEEVSTSQLWVKTDTLNDGIYQVEVAVGKQNYSFSVSIK